MTSAQHREQAELLRKSGKPGAEELAKHHDAIANAMDKRATAAAGGVGDTGGRNELAGPKS
jgi:hypothetical protein